MSPLPQVVKRPLRPLRRRLRPNPIERRLAEVEIRPGDVTLDCGANVGHATEVLADHGAVVHAFEPNPDAFAVLEARLGDRKYVQLYECAVLDRDAIVPLYLHRGAGEDPVGSSPGSSLLRFKGNVDPEQHVDVRAVDLAGFVLGLERRVALLKLDVEGVEPAILHRLLDSGAAERIDLVLVELHDSHVPELRDDTERVLARIEEDGFADRVRTDWV